MISRRSMLSGLGAASVLPLLPGCATINAVPADIGFAAIDIHAHFFNASDLPVAEFLDQVVLTDHDSFNSQSDFPSNGLRRAFIRLLTDILRYDTPTANEELAELGRAPSLRKRAARTVGAEAVQFGLNQQTARVRRQQQRAAERFNAASPDAPRSTAPSYSNDETLLGRIESSVGLSRRPGHGDFRSLEAAPQARASRVRRVVRQLYRQSAPDEYRYTGTIPTALRWAGMLTRRRWQIIDEYSRLYQTSARAAATPRGVVAASPSLVDFSYWLGLDEQKDEDRAIPSPLASQVDVFSRLAKQRDDIALIPFAPFDPLREIVGNIHGASPSLSLVQDAVLNKGFAGVKIYPPMGFRAIGNSAGDVDNFHADRVYRKALRAAGKSAAMSVGEALDTALRELYGWAEANNVPIKAHANNSIESQTCGGIKASPQYWMDVLGEFRRLKVNLAHFGGFEETREQRSDRCDPGPTDWEDLIGELITSSDAVYFDTGYWMELITDRRADRRTIIERAGRFFNDYPEAKTRIMYGTDWSMIGKDPGHERYLEIIDETIRDLFPGDLKAQQDYFGRNAIRFLGLGKNRNLPRKRETTRSRFESFYAGSKAFDELFALVDGIG